MENVLSFLEKIYDPRSKLGKRYKLTSILSLIITGYGAGCKSLLDVCRFGKKLNSRAKKSLVLLIKHHHILQSQKL